jgi:hypothetical protein
VLDVTISRRAALYACHQEAVACLRREDKNHAQAENLGLEACTLCAECGESCSLIRTVVDGKMYCTLCNHHFFRPGSKLFEEIGS